MSKTIKRKARHRYVYVVQFLGPGNGLAHYGAFLSHKDAVAWAQTERQGRTFQVIPLKLHSEKI